MTAHGASLEHCREQIRRAMRRRIRESSAAEVSRWKTGRVYRVCEMDVEVASNDARGRVRRGRIPMKFFVLLREHRESYVVTIPKLGLVFHLQAEDQLASALQEEVSAHFHAESAREVLEDQKGWLLSTKKQIPLSNPPPPPSSPLQNKGASGFFVGNHYRLYDRQDG